MVVALVKNLKTLNPINLAPAPPPTVLHQSYVVLGDKGGLERNILLVVAPKEHIAL